MCAVIICCSSLIYPYVCPAQIIFQICFLDAGTFWHPSSCANILPYKSFCFIILVSFSIDLNACLKKSCNRFCHQLKSGTLNNKYRMVYAVFLFTRDLSLFSYSVHRSLMRELGYKCICVSSCSILEL